MIERKDWEEALRVYRARLINNKVQLELDEKGVEICEREISKLPEEDPMPEEVKDIVKAVK